MSWPKVRLILLCAKHMWRIAPVHNLSFLSLLATHVRRVWLPIDCLSGHSLAYMELHLTLAHLFRRFDMTLRDTPDGNMDWKDCTVVLTMGDLKVKIREAKD